MPCHRFGFIPEKDAVFVVAADFIFLEHVVGVLVADGNAVPAVVFQKILFEKPVPNPPAKEQAVLSIVPGDAAANHRPLRTASRMHPKPGVPLAHATLDDHVVGLLKADSVPVEITYRAPPDHSTETAVQKDPSSPAAVEWNILLLVAVDNEVFHGGSLQVVAADHRKYRRRHGLIGDEAIRVQGRIKREGVPVSPDNPPHGGMKAPGLFVPHRNAVADLEAGGIPHGYLFFAVVSVHCQR